MLGSAYESRYLPWKWKQTLTPDGKTQIGLGTDVGGLAMCYRTDLFTAAGLPTERDQVSALLNRRLRAQTWFRVGVLLPYITPVTASTLIFSVVFAHDTGIANWALSL